MWKKALMLAAGTAILFSGGPVKAAESKGEKTMEVKVADFLRPGMTDSQAVRAALHAARNAPSRTLIFQGRDFILSEAVEVPSDTTVIIDDCTVRQADCTFDNVFRGANYEIDPENPNDYVLAVRPLKNVRILGKGRAVISGCAKNVTIFHPHFKEEQQGVGDFFGWRTHLLHFADLDGFEIAGFRIEKARGWTMAFGMSRNGHIHDVVFDTRVKNGDGIDLLGGCRHIVVENISGYTSDDTVAIAGCADRLTPPAPRYLYTGTPWFKELLTRGAEARNTYDVTIRNVHASGFYHAVILLCLGGAQMYDVRISDVRDEGSRNCHLVDFYTGYGYGSGYNPGDVHDVTVSGVDGNTDNRGQEAKAALTIQIPVRNVTVSGVVNRGGGKTCILTHPEGVTLQGLQPERVYPKLELDPSPAKIPAEKTNIAVAPGAGASETVDALLSKAFIEGRSDRSAMVYRPGEPITFRFQFHGPGLEFRNAFLKYERVGDDGAKFEGLSPIGQPLTVTTSLAIPGYVGIMVYLADQDGQAICWKRADGQTFPVGFYAGALIEPEKLEDCGEPAGFDAFWERQRKKLAEVPFEGKVTVKPYLSEEGIDYYTVSIPCAGNRHRPVTGFLGIPQGAKPGTLPAELHCVGHGTPVLTHRYTAFSKEQITLLISAHGEEMDKDAAYYEAYFKALESNGHGYAYDPEQNRDPETAYFNGMALRVLRALEYLKTRPEWNRRDLITRGGSQGGLQAVWGAALDNDVTECYPAIVWCCDLAGASKRNRWPASWRIAYTPALDYYDPVFMAKRIRHAKVEIPRAGLGDFICPPSGLAVFYRNLATPEKKIFWVQGSAHSSVPEHSEVIVWESSRKP